jgi:hypothetical protein
MLRLTQRGTIVASARLCARRCLARASGGLPGSRLDQVRQFDKSAPTVTCRAARAGTTVTRRAPAAAPRRPSRAIRNDAERCHTFRDEFDLGCNLVT